MAGGDYSDCSICGERAMYNANCNYFNVHSIVILCKKCSKNNDIKVYDNRSGKVKKVDSKPAFLKEYHYIGSEDIKKVTYQSNKNTLNLLIIF